MNLHDIAAESLQAAGDPGQIRESHPVGGGSISNAVRLRTDQGQYLLKWSARSLAGFFAAEAHGLQLLASTNTLRVPQVLAWRDSAEGQTDAFILLEWLASPQNINRHTVAEALGHGLAALHRTTAHSYGLDRDNYIGATPQPNGWMTSWLAFFRERRLLFQVDLAKQHGYLNSQRAQRLQRLLDQLDRWIDDRLVQPALLHGDLWGGNYLVGPGGMPALIDPAVYFGDREAELAFTTLFGGFPEAFYRAYDNAWPLPASWQERRDLYNLYHLLNHLNLFGESYGSSVDAILRRYIG